MTNKEAILAMLDGKKVTHKILSKNSKVSFCYYSENYINSFRQKNDREDCSYDINFMEKTGWEYYDGFPTKVFIINGQALSGKDTFVNMFKQITGLSSIRNVSSIDIPKIIAKQYFGWDGMKDKRSRKMLSDLKDNFTEYCDGPMNYMKRQFQLARDNREDFIFFHIREPLEISKAIKEFIGAESILIQRGSQKDFGNHADNNVFNHNYDWIVENNRDIEYLKGLVEMFIESIEYDILD